MTDYKKRQFQDDDFQNDPPEKRSMIGDSRKPYVHEHRPPEHPNQISKTLNDFYHNKEQYEAFVRLVGKDTAMRWMATLLERASK